MPFDFAPSDPLTLRGQTAYCDGLAAEDAVERDYCARGYDLLARRWRGAGAEIDLIFSDTTGFVFVEVKKARSHDLAAERLSVAQLRRIAVAGEVYASDAAPGRMVDMRFDLATVDSQGTIDIREGLALY